MYISTDSTSHLKGKTAVELDNDNVVFQNLVEQFPLDLIIKSINKTETSLDLSFTEFLQKEEEVLFAREELFKHWIDLFSYALELEEENREDPFIYFAGYFPVLSFGSNRRWFNLFLESCDYLISNTALYEEDIEELVFSASQNIFSSICYDNKYYLPSRLCLFRDDDGLIILCRQLD